ncbi:hypothetical protein CY34DRAFT_501737 [Suillus luteus UH-Slu-Lm8-n1]|uniref:Uncharacterized protein n=1 Tax=Suillus luteus UH-Slu-Lm8-n1 TaxID=930992 RepID=A0A0D0BHZ4_9AGAM|nr:hypothetical protein CY34DRAFT_501737 [Suillus luteus UH-Slu-Lm8-n1]
MCLEEIPPFKIGNDVAELTAQIAISLAFGSPYDNITNSSTLFDQSSEITLVLQGILFAMVKMFETVERMLCTRTLGTTAFAVSITAIVPLSSAKR